MSVSPSLLQSFTDDVSIELASSSTVDHLCVHHEYLSSDSLDNASMLKLLLNLSVVDENLLLYNKGYQITRKISDTLQGALFQALNLNATDDERQYVAIKKTDKQLFAKRVAIQGSTHFCVSENIVKESAILKYLTVDNAPIGNYIVEFVDFFESDDDYYLVMEYIESETNLKQFILQAKKYIDEGQMDINHYQSTIKYLLWQLSVTLQWLHLSMKCCHLDLCSENILLQNANFIDTKSGIKIDKAITIKLSDFGESEVFKMDYLCSKQPLSIDNTAYLSPKVFDEDAFNAECADNWSLGMLLFECMTVGDTIYKPLERYILYSGFWALKHDQLREYLALNKMLKYFNMNSLSLLSALLNFNEDERLNGINILQHDFFNAYYNKHRNQISKKFSRGIKGLSAITFYKC